jgi:uncharacterized lipoprotein YmbA
MKIPRRLASWMANLAVAGCASNPAPVLLTIPPIDAGTAPAAPAVATEAPRVLVVRRLEVPEYLLVQRVRYRADDSTLAEWPNTYWAERIETGIAREFNNALRQRLPEWHLCEANCGERSPALSLQVRLTRMDYVRSARRLEAGVRLSLWSTDRPPRLLHTEEHTYAIDGDADTPQSHARTLSAFLDRAAGDAALAVVH